MGPLRVQRPFYPEADGTCHTYVLHPPGGIAIGDRLNIRATLGEHCQVLLTTPSAGKVYGVFGADNAAAHTGPKQFQHTELKIQPSAFCEWLPQENIIFNTACVELKTRIHLEEGAKFIGWDIVRLGRAASNEEFSQGTLRQQLELWRVGRLAFLDKNELKAEDSLRHAQCGFQSHNTFATMVATVTLSRDQIDEVLRRLDTLENNKCWGVTQKNDLFIARYLGDSIIHCRKGLLMLWQVVRELMLEKQASVPRIWNT